MYAATPSIFKWELKRYEVPFWYQLIFFFHRNFVRLSFRWFMEKVTGKTLLERVVCYLVFFLVLNCSSEFI